MSPPVTHLYEFGHFRIDAIKRLLLRDGEIVPLQSNVHQSPFNVGTRLVLEDFSFE